MRALVIEDETKMAALMRRGPSAEGHAVDVSVRGEGAEVGPARFADHASAAIEHLCEPAIGVLAAQPAVATQRTAVVTKKVTGTVADANRWSTVQVVLVITKRTTGTKVFRTIKDLTGTYTYHTDRSQFIMSRSLPTPRSAALAAKTARIG